MASYQTPDSFYHGGVRLLSNTNTVGDSANIHRVYPRTRSTMLIQPPGTFYSGGMTLRRNSNTVGDSSESIEFIRVRGPRSHPIAKPGR